MFFLSRLWLENTVFLDVLAFLVEPRGWFAWCSWGPLLLLPFALGLFLVRLWPYFGLQALSRQLHRQELMADLSALCWVRRTGLSCRASWMVCMVYLGCLLLLMLALGASLVCL